ncbi:MAG: DNA recombination protein RmuC [Thermoleophilia bacterium]
MDAFPIVIATVAGVILGAVIVWLSLRSRIASAKKQSLAEFAPQQAMYEERLRSKDVQIEECHQSIESTHADMAAVQKSFQEVSEERARLETRIEEERKAAEANLAVVNEARQKMTDAFSALSAEALKSNNESFLQLAKSTLEKFQDSAKGDLDARQKAISELVTPVRESLTKMDSKLIEFDKSRVADHSSLSEQLKGLASTESELKSETSKLVQALHAPTVRGRWGEIQLKRVVEMAGMLPYCDFQEQVGTTTEDGRLRPDMIVKLPGQKNIVVDAKAPLEAYLNAIEAKDDESRKVYMKNHARQIKDHVNKLSQKNYWDQFQPTPEFVIMFLPGEHFFGAALEFNPHLIEEGVNQKVIIASPTTLIALLRAVAYGWSQEKIAESAQEISNLGKELYERLAAFTGHLNNVGKNLDNAITHYNKAVGSLESRVLVTARKFPDLGISSKNDIPEVMQSEKSPRELQAPET